jgi:aryl-alcohol dehydrogenase-like predicted oxidoreductase
MESVPLGRSGVEVSRIGLGMWQAGGKSWGTDVSDRDCIDAIVRSVECGVDLVDTAEVYGEGHSEEVVGKAIKEVGRDRLVVATKVAGYHMRERDVERACRGSLKRLGVRTIDLYQVHWPDPWDQVPFREGFRALERLWKRGTIRAIGVSNFAVRDLKDAQSHLSRAEIASNQVRYNLLQREIEAEVLPYCRREKITRGSFSSHARATCATVFLRAFAIPRSTRRTFSAFPGPYVSARTPWARGLHARIGIPIPGAKRPSQAEENAGAAGIHLTREELRRIEVASRTRRLATF